MAAERRGLLDVEDLGPDGIDEILDLSDHFVEVSARSIPRVPALRGKTVATLFFEDSTRTKVSFETAAKRLSADVMGFAVSTSSVSKGESLRDTALTLRAMGPDLVVVRHRHSGAPHRVAGWIDAPVVNAGDGWHQHPTQALLDLYTMREHFGRLDGLHVVVVGDIAHSRVAGSGVPALRMMGARVTLVAPPTLLPPIVPWDVEVVHDLDAALAEGPDVVYLLRMQRERQAEALVPSLREYTEQWGLTARRLAGLPDHTVLMHPGPMNRGVEISTEAADSPRSLVTRQVANGVAVRMAVLFHLLAGSGADLELDELPVDPSAAEPTGSDDDREAVDA